MKTRATTRPGSSIGKIGKTRVIGHKKLNRDIDNLANSLNKMIASFESIGKKKAGAKAKAGAINDFINSIRTEVRITGRR